jgi:CspA family cold shock protein
MVQLRGKIKWFDKTRRYGFVTLDQPDGRDAMLHQSAVDGLAPNSLKGAAVLVEIEETDRGPAVTKIVDYVLIVSAEPEEEPTGTFVDGIVKWYNETRGFGFVVVQGKDYFIHATTLKRDQISPLYPDQKVKIVLGTGRKGEPAALRISV